MKTDGKFPRYSKIFRGSKVLLRQFFQTCYDWVALKDSQAPYNIGNHYISYFSFLSFCTNELNFFFFCLLVYINWHTYVYVCECPYMYKMQETEKIHIIFVWYSSSFSICYYAVSVWVAILFCSVLCYALLCVCVCEWIYYISFFASILCFDTFSCTILFSVSTPLLFLVFLISFFWPRWLLVSFLFLFLWCHIISASESGPGILSLANKCTDHNYYTTNHNKFVGLTLDSKLFVDYSILKVALFFFLFHSIFSIFHPILCITPTLPVYTRIVRNHFYEILDRWMEKMNHLHQVAGSFEAHNIWMPKWWEKDKIRNVFHSHNVIIHSKHSSDYDSCFDFRT